MNVVDDGAAEPGIFHQFDPHPVRPVGKCEPEILASAVVNVAGAPGNDAVRHQLDAGVCHSADQAVKVRHAECQMVGRTAAARAERLLLTQEQ